MRLKFAGLMNFWPVICALKIGPPPFVCAGSLFIMKGVEFGRKIGNLGRRRSKVRYRIDDETVKHA